MVQAAMQGEGIALVPHNLFYREIDSGQIVPLRNRGAGGRILARRIEIPLAKPRDAAISDLAYRGIFQRFLALRLMIHNAI